MPPSAAAAGEQRVTSFPYVGRVMEWLQRQSAQKILFDNRFRTAPGFFRQEGRPVPGQGLPVSRGADAGGMRWSGRSPSTRPIGGPLTTP
jgi:hypothetical protein